MRNLLDSFLNTYSLGISFSIGAIIDEAQGAHRHNNYAIQRSTSYARSLIVFKWMIVGFILTISYKSVLRAMMMNIYYEKTIDSIEDMLASERTLWAASDTILRVLLASEPRKKVKDLVERVHFYKAGTGRPDDLVWLEEGYIFKNSYTVTDSLIHVLNFSIVNLKYVSIVPKFSPNKGKYGKAYASKEKLYVEQTAFLIPKSSPLKASIMIDLKYVH